MKTPFDAPPDPAEELAALLNASGVVYRREALRFRFLFSSRGCKWETVCDCRENAVLIYGRYPFIVENKTAVRVRCDSINSQVLRGSMFCAEDEILFRTSAELTDAFTAAGLLTRALEYNAQVVAAFWGDLWAAAQPIQIPSTGDCIGR